jgi:hypothetical protein
MACAVDWVKLAFGHVHLSLPSAGAEVTSQAFGRHIG